MSKYFNRNIIKKGLIIGTSIVLLLGVASCKKDNVQEYLDSSFAIVYKNKVPYLINQEKKTYSLAEYDDIIELFNDYICVKKNGKFGFINLTGKLVVDCIYDMAYPMYEEKAVVVKDNVRYIIDNTGNIIYTFAQDITSESYFSCNHLLVQRDGKYKYLEYNEENKSFTLETKEFDYGTSFNEDYAVVAIHDEKIIYKQDEDGHDTTEVLEVKELENLKYNFYSTDGNLLFDEYEFDYADNFHEGFARVGKLGEVSVAVVKTSTKNAAAQTKKIEGINYNYINKNKEYLHLNTDYYKLTYSYNSSTVNIAHTNELVSFPYACNFNDGYAVVAQLSCLSGNDTLIKNYCIIDKDGKMDYIYAIKVDTSFYYGYNNANEFYAKAAGGAWYNTVFKFNDTIVFKTGNTLESSYFKIKFAQLNYEEDRPNVSHPFNMFYNATYEICERHKEEGSAAYVYDYIPDWIIDYNDEYLDGVSSPFLAISAAESPYEMSDIKKSKYITSEYPLVFSTRINRSNCYGLLSFKYSSHTDTLGNELTDAVVYYILDPIYDKIIF